MDGARAKIEVIRVDINHTGRMRRTILNETLLDKPRGITVHPSRGYVFYTDWSSEKPCVCRAHLDGTSQVTRLDRYHGNSVVHFVYNRQASSDRRLFNGRTV